MNKEREEAIAKLFNTEKETDKKPTKYKTKRISFTIPDDPRFEESIREAVKLQIRFWKEKNL